MRADGAEPLEAVPGRVLLDTCVLNLLQDEGSYIWEGQLHNELLEDELPPDLRALCAIFKVNQRAMFQFVVSPLSVAELANAQDYADRERRVRWVMDALDHWLVMLDEIGDRAREGGNVRHRFKLTQDLVNFESRLLQIPDFRRPARPSAARPVPHGRLRCLPYNRREQHMAAPRRANENGRAHSSPPRVLGASQALGWALAVNSRMLRQHAQTPPERMSSTEAPAG